MSSQLSLFQRLYTKALKVTRQDFKVFSVYPSTYHGEAYPDTHPKVVRLHTLPKGYSCFTYKGVVYHGEMRPPNWVLMWEHFS